MCHGSVPKCQIMQGRWGKHRSAILLPWKCDILTLRVRLYSLKCCDLIPLKEKCGIVFSKILGTLFHWDKKAKFGILFSPPLLTMNMMGSNRQREKKANHDSTLQVPWQALIKHVGSGLICGGTVLNLLFVLTSAACVNKLTTGGDDKRNLAGKVDWAKSVSRAVFAKNGCFFSSQWSWIPSTVARERMTRRVWPRFWCTRDSGRTSQTCW